MPYWHIVTHEIQNSDRSTDNHWVMVVWNSNMIIILANCIEKNQPIDYNFKLLTFNVTKIQFF